MDKKPEKKTKIRLAYLDNIRSLVIILVIALHTAVTYSGLGSWYYTEGSLEKLSVFEMVFFGLLQSFIQAWVMGALFFISACLTTKALAKRGTVNYLKERFFRLGIPLLIQVFIIALFIEFVLLGSHFNRTFFVNIKHYILNFDWLSGTGPLWFAQALLIFCIIYATAKKFFKKPVKLQDVHSVHIIFTIFTITIIAFLIRIKLKVGSSFYNLQFPYFPSYIVMFIAGLICGENDLLENITNRNNIKWLKLSLIIGIPLWAFTMVFGGALEGKDYFNGGLNWQNFAFALWESFTAIGFSLGLIALFRKLNTENKFTTLMRDNAFGIYCFHAPILTAISLSLKNVVLNPILKFSMVFILASVLSLAFSFLVRKIKPVGLLYK